MLATVGPTQSNNRIRIKEKQKSEVKLPARREGLPMEFGELEGLLGRGESGEWRDREAAITQISEKVIKPNPR
jgi:hypothetical protein